MNFDLVCFNLLKRFFWMGFLKKTLEVRDLTDVDKFCIDFL
jgi:hypothetical protein